MPILIQVDYRLRHGAASEMLFEQGLTGLEEREREGGTGEQSGGRLQTGKQLMYSTIKPFVFGNPLNEYVCK